LGLGQKIRTSCVIEQGLWRNLGVRTVRMESMAELFDCSVCFLYARYIAPSTWPFRSIPCKFGIKLPRRISGGLSTLSYPQNRTLRRIVDELRARKPVSHFFYSDDLESKRFSRYSL
jgi:hypothetical protein